MLHRLVLACLVAGALVVPARRAVAQPTGEPPPRDFHQVRMAGEREVRVHTRWSAGAREGTVSLHVEGAQGPRRLHGGAAAVTAVATRGDTVLVAVGETRPGAKLHLYVDDLSDGDPPRAREVELPGRRAGGTYAVAATADADGFTVLWQMQDGADLRGARTAMVRLRADGHGAARAREIPVPWALADVAWNGRGYHVALYFDGAAPDQTRLSMVTLSAEGTPQQHPWWASQPGMVDEVQLVRVGERVVAAYRFGAEVRRRDVTEPGLWGGNVEPGARLLRLERSEELLLHVTDGQVRAEARRR